MNYSSTDKSAMAQPGFIGKLARFGRKQDGVVSIEAALLFPFMILLLLGMIDITYGLSLQRKVTVAASAVVDLTTQETVKVSTADLDQFILAADAILKPASSTQTKVELMNYRRTGNNVVQEWTHSRGGCGGAPPSLSGTTLDKLTQENNDVVIARVCLSFQPIIGYVIGTDPWTVEETVGQRPRNGLTLDCSNC